MRNQTRPIAGIFVLLLLAAMIPAPGGTQTPSAMGTHGQAQEKKDLVYVCACLKTKSCSCMTEAKTEGPCACGTQGGPPLKAVPRDSAWAKENREALAK